MKTGWNMLSNGTVTNTVSIATATVNYLKTYAQSKGGQCSSCCRVPLVPWSHRRWLPLYSRDLSSIQCTHNDTQLHPPHNSLHLDMGSRHILKQDHVWLPQPERMKSSKNNVCTEIGRAHVWTPVTSAHLVCRLLLEKKKKKILGVTTVKTLERLK